MCNISSASLDPSYQNLVEELPHQLFNGLFVPMLAPLATPVITFYCMHPSHSFI